METCTKAETRQKNASYQITEELILNITSGNQYFSTLIAIKKVFLLQIFSVDLNQNNQKNPNILLIGIGFKSLI